MTRETEGTAPAEVSSTAVGCLLRILLISKHIEPALGTKKYQVSPRGGLVLVGTPLDNRGGSDLNLSFLIDSSILGQLRGG
jgi:hypothetical protein